MTGLKPIDNRPIVACFRNDHSVYVSTSVREKIHAGTMLWRPMFCSTWEELGSVLQHHPDMICFQMGMVSKTGLPVGEFSNMVETLLKLTNVNKQIPITVSIDRRTTLTTIKELQKTSILGIVPCYTDFGVDETIKACDALINRIPYWPKYIIEQLPGAVKTVTKNTITLTQRQAEIADLISSRGLSNKKIATALNIAESTVKIHVSAILKAYGVRTRTQLAVLANR